MRDPDTDWPTREYVGGALWVYLWHLYHLRGDRPPDTSESFRIPYRVSEIGF